MMHRSAFLAGLALALAASPALAKDKDIVDTAVAAGSFKTLVTAVKEAGLVETLKTAGPFTVFAPTDEAFAALPKGALEALLKDKEKLTAVLTYHVVAGKVLAADAVKLDGKAVKTVQGQSFKVRVEDGKVFVNDAQVVKTDIHCSNGVIHVIDAVIMPPAKAEKPASRPGYEGGERAPIRFDDYFSLEAGGELVYEKSMRRASWLPAEKERLVRRPRARGEAIRVKDSEGEYQDYVQAPGGPALAGQSMIAQGFTQSYDPPLTLFPEALARGESKTFASIVTHDQGSSSSTGAVVREVELLGREAVSTPAGRFEDCLKVRVTMVNRPDIAKEFTARTVETIWLARGVGEVRSEQRVELKLGPLPMMTANLTFQLVERSHSPATPARHEPTLY